MKCQAPLEKRHAGPVRGTGSRKRLGKSERAKGTSHSKDLKRDGKVLRVHKGDCVWPVEGCNVEVFVTDVLLGDDNSLCVTCDAQRSCNQLEKHSRCKNSTSTLPLEKSTM